MKLHSILVASVTLFAGLVANSNVNALESHVYPGNECQPRLGSKASFFETYTRHIVNKGTSTMWVVCPIIRGMQGNVGYVTISVERLSGSTGKFLCWLDNLDFNGNFISYNGDTALGSGQQKLVINNPVPNSTHYQSIECALPPNSELQWYHISDVTIK